MARCDDGSAVAAAKILLSLRHRKLLRPPEWVPGPSSKGAPAAPESPMRWTKRWRRPRSLRAKKRPWSVALEDLLAHLDQGSSAGEEEASAKSTAARKPEETPSCGAAAGAAGSSTSGVVRASPETPHAKSTAARKPEEPPSCGAAAGSTDPSTSGVDRASPETPLDYAAAVGSGSDDDVVCSPAKRKSPAAGRSGGEAKRARAGVSGEGQAKASVDKEEPAAAAKAEEPKTDGGSRPLLFDLNEPPDMTWD